MCVYNNILYDNCAYMTYCIRPAVVKSPVAQARLVIKKKIVIIINLKERPKTKLVLQTHGEVDEHDMK